MMISLYLTIMVIPLTPLLANTNELEPIPATVDEQLNIIANQGQAIMAFLYINKNYECTIKSGVSSETPTFQDIAQSHKKPGDAAKATSETRKSTIEEQANVIQRLLEIAKNWLCTVKNDAVFSQAPNAGDRFLQTFMGLRNRLNAMQDALFNQGSKLQKQDNDIRRMLLDLTHLYDLTKPPKDDGWQNVVDHLKSKHPLKNIDGYIKGLNIDYERNVIYHSYADTIRQDVHIITFQQNVTAITKQIEEASQKLAQTKKENVRKELKDSLNRALSEMQKIEIEMTRNVEMKRKVQLLIIKNDEKKDKTIMSSLKKMRDWKFPDQEKEIEELMLYFQVTIEKLEVLWQASEAKMTRYKLLLQKDEIEKQVTLVEILHPEIVLHHSLLVNESIKIDTLLDKIRRLRKQVVTAHFNGCPGDGWLAFQSKCYKVFQSIENWNKSKEMCHGLHPAQSSKLAELHDQETITFMKDRGSLKGTYKWIGLYKGPNGWKDAIWEDGSLVKETFWDEKMPQVSESLRPDCVAINTEGRWRNEPCKVDHSYICQADKFEKIK